MAFFVYKNRKRQPPIVKSIQTFGFLYFKTEDKLEDISFYVPIEILEKGGEHGKNGIIDIRIGGVISTDSPDFDGDIVNQDGIAFDLWKSGFGRIKYEHNKDPKYFIGYPSKVIRDGKRTIMEGNIFATPGTPQYDIASQCVGDIQNIIAWNKSHAENPRKIGFSIEGGVLNRKGKHVDKSVATNVVITANPRNSQTYVDLLKSFEAGSAVNSGDMTGSQAGRVQSLKGNYINLITGVNQMGFKSKEDVTAYFVGKGMSKEDASAKAEVWATAQKKLSDRNERFEKSFNSINEAMGNVEELVKSLQANPELEKLEKSFESEISKATSHDNVDPVPFMKALGESGLGLQKSMTMQNVDNARLGGILLGVMREVLEMQKSLGEDIQTLSERTDASIEESLELRKSIADIDVGLATSGLSGFVKAGDKSQEELDREARAKNIPNKRKVTEYLIKSLEAATDDTVKARYSNACAVADSLGFEKLDPAMQDEIRKSFES